jgi:glycosidase
MDGFPLDAINSIFQEFWWIPTKAANSIILEFW